MDWKSLVETCEGDLRAAKVSRVAARLRDISSGKVPRKFALPIANLSRRSGLITLALRILAPILLPNRKKSNPALVASPQEIAEYAVCLQRFGAVREACDRLDALDFEVVPEALLYRAFCDFNQWRYAEAIPLLRKYLACPMDAYSALVGRTNLAAALVATLALQEADHLISGNLLEAGHLGVRRLEGNNYELRAQICLQQQDYGKLHDVLTRAQELLKEEGGFESGFVQKWKAIALALNEGQVEVLLAYRSAALLRQDWENVRDADRYLLKVKFDKERFNHLVFGSPNENFRNRIYHDLKCKPDCESYVLGSEKGSLLDVHSGTFRGKPLVEVGQKPWQLLLLLSRDLYKPVSIGELFSTLYSGERFNVFSSPARIHQLMARLRGILRSASVPVQIVEFNGSYSLKANAGASLRLRIEARVKTTHEAQLEKIANRIPNGLEFSAQQAAEILNLPETTLRRFLRWGIDSGHLLKLGAGYNTRYVAPAPPELATSFKKMAA